MIKPHKYFNYNNSVLIIGAKIIDILKYNRTVRYEIVLEKLIKSNGEESKYIFPQAISFLFLLGKIEYCKETDELELII